RLSSLIVEVCRVDAVEPHPNADRLSVCVVKGWRVCAGRDDFRPGDACVYIPPDSVLPAELSDRLGCTRYLSRGRVRVARLRGEPSYGLITAPPDPTLAVGTDVAALLGVTKYEPPPDRSDGDAEPPHPAFHGYTDIENYRHFPDLFAPGEEVVMAEKIHGKNCRLGLIRTADGGVLMAGSHNQRRKEYDGKNRRSQFWQVMTEPVQALLRHVGPDAVLFGELYGAGVQDLWYGLEGGKIAFRAFDLSRDGRYADHDEVAALCARFGVEAAPVVYRGPFSQEAVEAHVSGPTTLCPADRAGAFKFREGVVIRPARERLADFGGRGTRRVILKAISFEYLERKGGSEHH
ncbi:MAG: RNA ligase (ATP), partial [Gemmataceae bacterium]